MSSYLLIILHQYLHICQDINRRGELSIKMSIRSEIKYLLSEENYTITKLAEQLSVITDKKYTMKNLSQKLKRNALKIEEYKLILNILGYELKLIKKKN